MRYPDSSVNEKGLELGVLLVSFCLAFFSLFHFFQWQVERRNKAYGRAGKILLFHTSKVTLYSP